MRNIISPWALFNNTFPFPFTVSLLLPLPFPLPVLSRLPVPLPIICYLLFPGPLLTAPHVLLTLPVVIVIVIARTAKSIALRSGIRPVLIIIILLDYLIPMQWSNGQDVAWFVLLAAWRLNLCPVIIATVPCETLAGAFNLCRTASLRIGVIHLISEGMGVIPSPVVHLEVVIVKHLRYI